MPSADHICEQEEQDPGQVTNRSQKACIDHFLAIGLVLHILWVNGTSPSVAS